MAFRSLISDALWLTIEPVLRELKHAVGSPPKLSNRMFIEAVLYQAHTGTPWRDLPNESGDWNAVYLRYRHWEKRELWKRLWGRSRASDDEQIIEQVHWRSSPGPTAEFPQVDGQRAAHQSILPPRPGTVLIALASGFFKGADRGTRPHLIRCKRTATPLTFRSVYRSGNQATCA